MNLPAGLTWRSDHLPQGKEGAETEKRSKPSVPVNKAAEPGESGKSDPAAKGEGQTQTQTKKQPSMQEACMDQAPIMIGLLVVFYFLLIRPGQKQEKKLKALRSSLKKDDQIVTSSGMHGTVVSVDESASTVRISTDQDGRNLLTFDLSAVGRVVRPEATNQAGD